MNETTIGGEMVSRRPRAAQRRPRPWLALAVIALAQLMIVLDVTIVKVGIARGFEVAAIVAAGAIVIAFAVIRAPERRPVDETLMEEFAGETALAVDRSE